MRFQFEELILNEILKGHPAHIVVTLKEMLLGSSCKSDLEIETKKIPKIRRELAFTVFELNIFICEGLNSWGKVDRVFIFMD